MARLEETKLRPFPAEESEAHELAARMPALLIEAQRVAHTVTHGIHGRRRAGPGETFWQFRHFDTNDSYSRVDWRRSASSDNIFVREREWEAAHTAWLWVDLSPSMRFRSYLAPCTKEHRALVLALSLSDLLARGGERIGVFGGRPYTGRHVAHRIAEALVADDHRGEKSLPPPARLSRFAECILFSDWLEPIEATAECLEAIAAQGVRGHLVQILDPAEETLPYDGRTEFTSIERNERVTIGRVEQLRERYQARIKRHRTDLIELTKRLDWSFLVHHTDRPAEEALLALHNRLAGLETDYRYRAPMAAQLSETESEPHP